MNAAPAARAQQRSMPGAGIPYQQPMQQGAGTVAEAYHLGGPDLLTDDPLTGADEWGMPADRYNAGAPRRPMGPAAPAEAPSMAAEMSPSQSAESWATFLELARAYKQRQPKIATIYIDEDLKTVLDRLKTAGLGKISTTSIVSAIVAQFITDHQEQLRETLYTMRPLKF